MDPASSSQDNLHVRDIATNRQLPPLPSENELNELQNESKLSQSCIPGYYKVWLCEEKHIERNVLIIMSDISQQHSKSIRRRTQLSMINIRRPLTRLAQYQALREDL